MYDESLSMTSLYRHALYSNFVTEQLELLHGTMWFEDHHTIGSRCKNRPSIQKHRSANNGWFPDINSLHCFHNVYNGT